MLFLEVAKPLRSTEDLEMAATDLSPTWIYMHRCLRILWWSNTNNKIQIKHFHQMQVQDPISWEVRTLLKITIRLKSLNSSISNLPSSSTSRTLAQNVWHLFPKTAKMALLILNWDNFQSVLRLFTNLQTTTLWKIFKTVISKTLNQAIKIQKIIRSNQNRKRMAHSYQI